MAVLLKYTFRTLRKNRMRTIVTIIGIVLSMALVTAVIEGGYSGMQYLIRVMEESSGRFHGYFGGMSPEEAAEVPEMSGVSETAELREVGWAEIGSQNPGKPYLLVASSEDFAVEKSSGDPSESGTKGADTKASLGGLLPIRLIEGRMPENDTEILLPDHLSVNGEVSYEIGDVLELDLGKRLVNGNEAHEDLAFGGMSGTESEEIADTVRKTYTVVGFYERFSYEVEYMRCPGYTALTKGGAGDSVRVFFRLKNVGRFSAFERAHSTEEHPITAHSELLAFTGRISDGGLQSVFYGFVGILVFLVAFGSISLIYNSFSISVSERTRQYGILKSVGATKAQIRTTVLMEALTLSLIAIPIGLLVGCAGIGITLYLLRGAFTTMFEGGIEVRMQLVLNPAALGIAALVSLITVLISAFIPAKRAIRVSPIRAIRSSDDVRIRPRAVKTSALTQKLFGFEGMMASKNFKRNRKRYRATVVSIFLSVVLFISASSFSSYLKASAGGLEAANTASDVVWGWSLAPGSTDLSSVPERLRMASDLPGVTDASALVTVGGFDKEIDREFLDQSFLRNPYEDFSDQDESGPVRYFIGDAFIDDEHFDAYAKECGTSREELSRDGKTRGILYNSIRTYYYTNEGRKFFSFDILKKDAVPAVIPGTMLRELAGYSMVNYDEDADSVTYYPLDYLEELDREGRGIDEADPEKAVVLSMEEAHRRVDFPVGALSRKLPLGPFRNNDAMLIYPMSALPEILPEEALTEGSGISCMISMRSENHSETTSKLNEILEDSGVSDGQVNDLAAPRESIRMAILVINVFSYGFIILISLIAAANVFNTISTNILLRRREFAMLKSVGLSESGFRKMLNYECLIYGLRGLLFGLPAAVLMTFAIYSVARKSFELSFYIPWQSVVIAVGSVFLVVFATMIYARRKLSKDNPIDALKLETL